MLAKRNSETVKRLSSEAFAGHVASVHRYEHPIHGATCVVMWSAPGSGTYRQYYEIREEVGQLITYGDMYPGVYQWTGKISLEWLAGLDSDYFAGKCVALRDTNKVARECSILWHWHGLIAAAAWVKANAQTVSAA